MLNNLKNKQITVYIGSNSGTGISNGSHGARTSVSSTITISGILFDFDDKYLYLKDTTTSMLTQLGVNTGFNDKDKLITITSANTLISLDQILFMNF